MIRYRSTYVVLTLALVMIALLNVPGELIIKPQHETYPYHRYYLIQVHGWPLHYLERSQRYWPRDTPDPWNLSENVLSFNERYLAVDVLVGVLVIAVVGVIYEWWRRRHTRLWQLSLRELFVLMCLVCCAGGYYAANRTRQARELAALTRLNQSHAKLELKELHAVEFYWQRGGPTWLRQLVGDLPFAWLDYIHTLEFSQHDDIRELRNFPKLVRVVMRCPLTDEAREELAKLSGLEVILVTGDGSWEAANALPLSRLRFLAISQARETHRPIPLESLRNLPALEVLDLCDCELAGDLSAVLETSPRLRVLRLLGTALDDRDLAAIAKLPVLKELDLRYTKITNRSLAALQSMRNLKVLYLWECEIGPREIQQLQAALPNCVVNSPVDLDEPKPF